MPDTAGRGAEISAVRLGPEHLPALRRFFEGLASDASAAALFHPHPFTAEQAATIANYGGTDYYAALLVEDEIVAYGMLRGWDEGYAIPSLGISVARGRRGLGLGRRMMEHLHAVARARQAPSIMLRVYKHNEPAVALYRHMDYMLTELNDQEWRGTFSLRTDG